MAETLTAEQAQTLLDGVDAAFEAVLHARYGGGLQATIDHEAAEPVILRTPRAGTEAVIHLDLQRRGALSHPSMQGTPIGTAQMSAGSGVATTIQTEIFLDQDCNEHGDATALASGVLIQPAPASLPNGGLLVVRSVEAGANHGRMRLAEQQNWRPNPNRHVSSAGLGASGRSHRPARPACLLLPVGLDLIARLGSAVASACPDVSKLGVVLLPGDGGAG